MSKTFDIITGNGIRVGRETGKTHRDGRPYIELLHTRSGKWKSAKATDRALMFDGNDEPFIAREIYREARERGRTSNRLITEEAIAIRQERAARFASR
jgi:hypothetical protein